MNTVGWVLVGVFLALLVAGVGLAIWAVVRPADELRGRAGVVAVSVSVALAGLVGAIVVAMRAPGPGGGGMMRGMGGMAGTMDGSSKGTCPSKQADAFSATIEGFRFCPGTLRIPAGTVVSWTNRDSAPHTVTSRSGGQFDSGSFAEGRSWSHRFEQAGTVRYYCRLHPWMEGTVEVTGARRTS